MKLQIPKNWREQFKTEKNRKSKSNSISLKVEVIKSEDLPELLKPKEAAKILRVHEKTIEEYRNTNRLKFIKKGGRYFTTPEWIAEHLEREAKFKIA